MKEESQDNVPWKSKSSDNLLTFEKVLPPNTERQVLENISEILKTIYTLYRILRGQMLFLEKDVFDLESKRIIEQCETISESFLELLLSPNSEKTELLLNRYKEYEQALLSSGFKPFSGTGAARPEQTMSMLASTMKNEKSFRNFFYTLIQLKKEREQLGDKQTDLFKYLTEHQIRKVRILCPIATGWILSLIPQLLQKQSPDTFAQKMGLPADTNIIFSPLILMPRKPELSKDSRAIGFPDNIQSSELILIFDDFFTIERLDNMHDDFPNLNLEFSLN